MQLLIDYEALAGNAAAALKRLVAMFEKAGLTVVDATSDGRAKRSAGISFREAVLTFADSQKLTLKVKATGDVFQVALNGKASPVSQQDDPTQAVAELASMLDSSRARFQKRLAALQMKPPEGAKTAAPRIRQQLEAQVAELDTQIADAQQEVAALTAAA